MPFFGTNSSVHMPPFLFSGEFQSSHFTGSSPIGKIGRSRYDSGKWAFNLPRGRALPKCLRRVTKLGRYPRTARRLFGVFIVCATANISNPPPALKQRQKREGLQSLQLFSDGTMADTIVRWLQESLSLQLCHISYGRRDVTLFWQYEPNYLQLFSRKYIPLEMITLAE